MKGQEKPRVVVLGGGTGMPVLLQGLKEYPIDLTAVVTVADDGGSTGEIRNSINIPAPGDIRNVICALANVDDDLKQLFQYRFEGEHHIKGHALGNLLLAATHEITSDFHEAVAKIAKLFNVQANIFPIVNESVTLHAKLEDGSTVSGESKIPLKNQKIEEVMITPENVRANQAVIDAIIEADMVVISPGSLYTSILPNLIISDVIEAMQETSAQIVYVCNIMTQPGETDDYTASDHVKAIYHHIGIEKIDTIIVHNEKIEPSVLEVYEEEGSYQVQVDYEELLKLRLNIVEENIIDSNRSIIRHNYKKVASLLHDLVTEKNK